MPSYEELTFKLGDLAYERLWDRPNAPRGVARVLKAAESYEQKQLELREVEEAMDAEEAAFAEFRQACDDESAECQATIDVHAKAVDVAESKAKAVRARALSKRKDLEAGRAGLARQEQQIKQWEEVGEADKARSGRESIKKAKLDLMKRQREIEELDQEYDAIMNPESGPAADGIRARRRQIDLSDQLAERTRAYRELMAQLNEQAPAKEREVSAARDYYEQALAMLGEEVYRQRLNEPDFAPFYAQLDKLSR